MDPERERQIRSIFGRLDYQISHRLIKAQDEGFQMPCRAGCFGCCKEPVYAEKREVELIADRIRATPEPERSRVEEALKVAVHKLTHSPPGKRLMKEDMPNAYDFRAMNIWCPLLKDGKCSVYDIRPSSCRMHIAMSNPEKCHDDSLRRSQRFLMMNDLSTNSQSIGGMTERVFDNLLTLLHNELFGTTIFTGSAVEVKLEP